MSIADSVLSMRVPAPFQPLSGRISKQSSLSIHSNNPLGPPGALSGLTGDKGSGESNQLIFVVKIDPCQFDEILRETEAFTKAKDKRD